jgi:uncharacterized protein YyaL (SSP411 family)
VKYPEFTLEHLLRLTDDTGVIQHARYHLPYRATGYTTDDNARALLAALNAYQITGQREALPLVQKYLTFLHYAQLPSGHFHNFMNYDRSWADQVGSEDSFGRAVWALGEAAASLAGRGEGAFAREMFLRALPWTVRLKFIRGQAFSLLGLCEYLAVYQEAPVKSAAATLAQKLLGTYHREASEDWPWFEDRLTYSNAILPAALFAAYRRLGGHELLEVAERSLAFLTDVMWHGRYFKLIGCHGWYVRGGEPAPWDEQPEDAGCLVLAYSEAQRATGKKIYLKRAEAAFEWFLGRNARGESLYNPETGGCHDGLTPSGVNANQGAESLLAYLLSHLEVTAALSTQTKQVSTSG